jgi:hypothetical protein
MGHRVVTWTTSRATWVPFLKCLHHISVWSLLISSSYSQCSKWKFRNAGILLKTKQEYAIRSKEKYKRTQKQKTSSCMAYTGPFRALPMPRIMSPRYSSLEVFRDNFYVCVVTFHACCMFRLSYSLTYLSKLYYRTVHQWFVDFKKAFDSVRRTVLYLQHSWTLHTD